MKERRKEGIRSELGTTLSDFEVNLVAFSVYDGGFGATCWSFSTSRMMLMCISGGLEGLKTKNVEKVFVFKTFLEVRVPPRNRLAERSGGVGRG